MDYHYNEIKGGDHNQSFANNPEMISEIYDFFDKREKSRSKLTAPRELRVFTNRKGIEIKASVESVASDKATIIREDGKKFILPISMFFPLS